MPPIDGPALRAWRERHRLSQGQLAAILDCGARSIRGWETGEAPPPPWLAPALGWLELAGLDARYDGRPVDLHAALRRYFLGRAGSRDD